MANALTVVFYGMVVVGLAAVAGAVVRPAVRPHLLVIAAVAFAVTGVLGIFSIGLLLLIVSAVCAWQALWWHSRDRAV